MSDVTSTAPQPLSLFSRIIGVITSPRATMENVVAAPRPAGVLLVAALLISIGATLPQFTEAGQQASLDMQVQGMERFGVTVTPEMYATLEERARNPYLKLLNAAGTLIFMPVAALFFAVIYWGVFNTILGGTAAFKQVLAIVTHSQIIGALGILAAAPVQLMQGKMTMTGPFTLGALVPMADPGGTLTMFLGSISVFSLWGFVVTAIGLSVLFKRKTLNIAIGLITAYLLVMFGIISLFGSFMGHGA